MSSLNFHKKTKLAHSATPMFTILHHLHPAAPRSLCGATCTVLQLVYRAAQRLPCSAMCTVLPHMYRALHVSRVAVVPCSPCSTMCTVPCCTTCTVLHHVPLERVSEVHGASCSSSPLCRNWVYTSCLWPGRLSGRKWMGWNRPDRLIRDFLRLIINFRGMLPRPREEAPIDSF
jgi:hypothetical protein